MNDTGLLPINAILRGGLPTGLVDIFGETGAGKTAFCAGLVKQASAEGRQALWVATTPIEKNALLRMGVPQNVPVVKAVHWSALTEVLVAAFTATPQLLVIIDSATGLETQVSTEDMVGNTDPVENLRELYKALALISEAAQPTGGTLVLISEVRAVMNSRNRVRSALPHACGGLLTARLQFRIVELKSAYGEVHYKKVSVKVLNNLLCPPGGEWVLHNFVRTGFDPWLERLKWGIAQGTIINKGAYWVLENGTLVGPGYSKAVAQLKEEYE
jgi:RecA/RadA recombinase